MADEQSDKLEQRREVPPGLDPYLRRVLEEVGPERYAAAAAHAFAPGGLFNRERRPRYAKM
jgi:hypothetical protein